VADVNDIFDGIDSYGYDAATGIWPPRNFADNRQAASEAELEPRDLIRKSHLVHRVGRTTLAAGHGSYRVKAHMQRVGAALGLDAIKAQVALTEITTTATKNGIFRTEVSEVRTVGINADRLAELEDYIGSLPPRITDDEFEAELDRITGKEHLHPNWLNALAAGFACAGFAFLNGGGPVECFIVLLAAASGQYLRRQLIKRGINQVGATMLVATVSCLIYLGLVMGIGLISGGTGYRYIAGYTSAVLFLVPGFPLVTGALDLARLDLTAGITRLAYALMILGSAAIAVWAVSAIVGLEPQPMPGTDLAPHIIWTLRAVASFLAGVGFAIIFNSPWRMAFAAALVGTVANLVRLFALNNLHWRPQAAAFAAALLVGLLARGLSTPLKVPRLTISVPAVVIMVPGVLIYRAVYEANMGLMNNAIAYGVEAGFVVMALAVGLGVARMLTDKEWTFESQN